MRDGRGVTFGGWRPSLRTAQDDVAAAFEAATARTIDLSQNNGWVSGMIEQAAANTVGLGLRLRAQPENDLIGMSEADAQVWRKLVEARWQLWSNTPLECDLEGTRTIGQMQDAAFKHWVATGEILAELVWRRRPISASRTKVRLLSSTRIVNRTDQFSRLHSGIRVNADGLPISIVSKRTSPHLGEQEFEVPMRDRFGRPLVIHVFTGAPGQRRGISPITPALKVARQFDQLADATLVASLIQTIFAASITADMPTEDTLRGLLSQSEQARLLAGGGSPFDAWFEAQAGWYDAHPIDVGYNGRIAHLFNDQKLEFHSPEQPTSAYKDFSLHLLREMARCLGLTYGSATGDHSGETYTGARMGVADIYPITRQRRKNIISPFVQPIYEAWLEEEIATGMIPFPGGYSNFLLNRAAATRAAWTGEPKPIADDLKSAKAAEVYRNMGVLSDQDIADDLGRDIEDVYAQRAREAALREKYGLPENCYPAALSATEQIEEAPEPAPAGG
ncbi:MAG: phage portal protein [Devosia ginsengisoli]|nr:phage portal protein [Devosia ginsengisoli]